MVRRIQGLLEFLYYHAENLFGKSFHMRELEFALLHRFEGKRHVRGGAPKSSGSWKSFHMRELESALYA